MYIKTRSRLSRIATAVTVNQSFIVEVPELPGCAADGETYQEAVQNVEIVIQEWIETAQAWLSFISSDKFLLFLVIQRGNDLSHHSLFSTTN